MKLDAFNPETRTWLLGTISLLLEHSRAFAAPRTWPHAVVVLRHERADRHVTSRADFAAFLKANDLAPAATECTSRKVAPGCVLVWIESDEGVSFLVVDVVAEARALRERGGA